MQHLEGSGTPVLYIGRTVLKDQILANRVNPDQTSTEYINITLDGIYRRSASSGRAVRRLKSILHKLKSLKLK